MERGRKGGELEAGRYRHVQVSEPFSIEDCDQVMLDMLVATEVGKFAPKWLQAECGADPEADSGAGSGGSGFISFRFFSVCLSIF